MVHSLIWQIYEIYAGIRGPWNLMIWLTLYNCRILRNWKEWNCSRCKYIINGWPLSLNRSSRPMDLLCKCGVSAIWKSSHCYTTQKANTSVTTTPLWQLSIWPPSAALCSRRQHFCLGYTRVYAPYTIESMWTRSSDMLRKGIVRRYGL